MIRICTFDPFLLFNTNINYSGNHGASRDTSGTNPLSSNCAKSAESSFRIRSDQIPKGINKNLFGLREIVPAALTLTGETVHFFLLSRRKRKAHHVLQRMSVDGDNTDGSGPIVVLFVVMLVEAGVVEQPEENQRNKMNA